MVSLAYYDASTNTISIARSVKGEREEATLSFLRFELHNAEMANRLPTWGPNDAQSFSDQSRRHRYQYLQNPQAFKQNFERSLAAKYIVDAERVEYENVIRLVKREQANKRPSEYLLALTGGVHAPWASFEQYLATQCAIGHYKHLDPDVDKPNWIGWTFLTPSDKERKDRLA